MDRYEPVFAAGWAAEEEALEALEAGDQELEELMSRVVAEARGETSPHAGSSARAGIWLCLGSINTLARKSKPPAIEREGRHYL